MDALSLTYPHSSIILPARIGDMGANMEATTGFAIFLSFLGLVSIGTPIAYLFLRLAGKIGPRDGYDAFSLGIILFIFGITIGLWLISVAGEILGIEFLLT